jgi:PAS domain S-box-containing protein
MNAKNYRSRGKARVLLNLLSDPAAIVDEKGNFLIVNDAFLEVTGLSRKELIGDPFLKLDILSAESKVVLLENLEKRMQGAPVKPYEVCFTAKAGEKWVEVKGKKVSYAGQPANLVVFHDVTLRKENARRLKEYSERMEALVKEKVKEIQDREEKYRKLFDESLDAIFVADVETGIIVDCNPAASTLVGREKSELVGQHQSIFTPHEQMDGEFARVFKQHLKDQTNTLETQIVRKTGEIRDVTVRDSIFELNGKKLMQGTIRDNTEEKLFEQRLKEAEKRYHALFDQAPLGVLVVDPETTALVEFNDVANRQLGYSKEEFAKLRIADIEAKETADGVKAHTSRMVKEGGSEFETKHRTKDGEVRDVLVTTRTVELGGKTFLYCIFHDITDIRKVQDALMKSETQYRQLVELAQEGVWALDNEYCTAFVNPRMAQMLGYAESEMVGRSIFEFVDKKDIEQTKQLLGQSKHGVKGHFEYEFTRKDGSRVYASIAASAINDDEENRLGTLALVADVTEDKRMQKELKQEHFRLEAIANSIGAGFVIISPDYRILWANRFMREYKGNVDGKLCYATLNTLDAPCPDCGVKKVLEEGVSWDAHEYFSTDIKGNPYWVELIATPIKDADGKVETAIEVAVDITEKKNLQNKLAQYSQKLEKLVEERTKQLEEAQLRLVKSERLAAIGELAGMVGHDLRNPLTGIENAAYFLKTKGATISEAQAKEMLETIGKCVEHSNKIVSDLFDYSKEIRLELQESSPRNVLSEALDMVQVPAKVEILNLIPDEQHLNVDPDKIERVFINLIKNAIDAMPNGGKITIDSKEANGSLEISFADIGTGISNEILPKIFSPLFTTKAQGMGLGLAICKRIIEAHGGIITVKTAKGKGTTFTVTLPIKREPEIGGEKVWINMPEYSLSTMTKA